MKKSEYIFGHIHADKYTPSFHSKSAVIFVHGFASDSSEWDTVCNALGQKIVCYSINLPGCGKSAFPFNLIPDAESLSIILSDFIASLPETKKVLCGYSMGARLCLYYTSTQRPDLKLVILESGTPGFEDERARGNRKLEDEGISQKIRNFSNDEFEGYWKLREIFNSQSQLDKQTLKVLDARRRNANPTIMAEFLHNFGTGAMSPLWNYLPYLQVPVVLITGSLDEKFTHINTKMCENIPKAEHIIIPHAGHNSHLEKPADFVNLITEKLLLHQLI